MEQQPNNMGNRPRKQPAPRRARLRLPFENRKQDPVDWIFEKRFGIFATLIVVFTLLVVAIWAKFEYNADTKEKDDTVYIEISDMQVQKQKPEEKREQTNSVEDWQSVQNAASNEEALEGEMLRKDKGLDPELKKLQESVAKDLDKSKKSREESLREIDKKSKSDVSVKRAGDIKNTSVKVEGNVTVSYSFKDPVRHDVDIVIPAYLCENSGKVVVEAVLNQSGEVISAKAISGGDERMRRIAEEYARKSMFNIDNTAPKKQKGTITYIFVAQ